MKRGIVGILFTLMTMSLVAQEKYIEKREEMIKLSEQVVEDFMKNDAPSGFDKLLPYWPLPENEILSLEEKTVKYLNVIKDRFGDPYGFVKVKTEKIGDFAIRDTYMVQYDFNAIRVIFTYYKNPKGWIVNAFKWDDTFKEEFVIVEE
jgi:hypothetical protein